MLVPAYAATIHKSQGSEYPAVVIPVMTQHYAMLQRNLLCTGVTRGKRLGEQVAKDMIAVRIDADGRPPTNSRSTTGRSGGLPLLMANHLLTSFARRDGPTADVKVIPRPVPKAAGGSQGSKGGAHYDRGARGALF